MEREAQATSSDWNVSMGQLPPRLWSDWSLDEDCNIVEHGVPHVEERGLTSTYVDYDEWVARHEANALDEQDPQDPQVPNEASGHEARTTRGMSKAEGAGHGLYLHDPDGCIRALQRSVVAADGVTCQLFSTKFLAVTDGALSFIPEVESVVQNLASRHSLQLFDIEDMRMHAVEVVLRGLDNFKPYFADPLLWMKRAVRSSCLDWLRGAHLRVPVKQLEAWAVEAGVDVDALPERDEEGRKRIGQLRDHIPPAYLPPLPLSGYGDEDIERVGTPVTTGACGIGSITAWAQLDSLRTLWTRLDEQHRQIALLSEQEVEDVEIAATLGRSLRTVERRRAQSREKARPLIGEVVG